MLDDVLTLRVAARYYRSKIALSTGEGESEPTRKGKVPPKWKEWLDATQEGGKRKVPNPSSDPKSRERSPEVAFSTALKNKSFYGKAIKEYYEWVGKQKDEGTPEKKPAAPAETPSETKSKGDTSDDSKGSSNPLELDEKRITAIIEENKEQFDKLTKEMTSTVKSFKSAHMKKRYPGDQYPNKFKKAFDRLTPQEQALWAGGNKLGQHFQEYMAKQDPEVQRVGRGAVAGWRIAGDFADSESVQNMIGAVESWGVKGSRTPKEEEGEAKEFREDGAKNKKLKEYTQKVYEYTQAYYKHLGIKELTLFRGVKGQGLDKAKKGSDASLDTRSISSFSYDASRADAFGKAIEFKIPIEKILMSNTTHPELGTEAEILVLGGTHDGKVL